MTIKDLMLKDDEFAFIEEMRANKYEDLYQEVSSLLNGEEEINNDIIKRIYDIKDEYERKMKIVLDGDINDENSIQYHENIELNNRAFNRMLGKYPTKEFTLECEEYLLGSLKFKKVLIDEEYKYSIISPSIEMFINEDEYNSIAFGGDLEVLYSSKEYLRLNRECIVKKVESSGEVSLVVESETGRFPKIIGKCCLDEDIKKLFVEEKKVNKVDKVDKVKKVNKVNKVDKIEDLSALEELEI